MIDIDLSKARAFLTDKEWNTALDKANEAFDLLQNGKGKGSEWLGWREILADPNDAVLEQIDRVAAGVRSDADLFVVCGIGGSYLGARAIIEALQTPFDEHSGTEICYAGHHLSGKYLRGLLNYLEKPGKEGDKKSVFLNVISKSGTTLETALSFRNLQDWIREQFPEEKARRIICTTSPTGGALNKFVKEYKYRKFMIPENVGGRFSALTPVGLLPAAVAGVDIRTLFYEAVSLYEQLEKDPGPAVEYAACKFALCRKGKSVDVLASFEPELQMLGRWLQQLFGESEGKRGKGMLPVVSTYSTDLHSLGQYIQEGSRTVIETILSIEESSGGITVGKTGGDKDGLNYLSGKTFHEINARAREGTVKAHVEGEVPCVQITLNELNAQHIGEFIYLYQLVTVLYCYCLEVNPFNQPGVESYKKEMYNLLGNKS